jgi:hypothetical protein
MPVVNPPGDISAPVPLSGSTLAAQDSSRQLAQIFTGQRVGQPTMSTPKQGHVVSATLTTIVVTIDRFKSANLPQPTYVCVYEPRWYWDGSANVRVPPPPKGTPCLVVFPPNTPTIWVTSFTGYPTV